MKRLSVLLVAVLLYACAGAGTRSGVLDLARLREEVARTPKDASLRVRLLEAEMFDPDGDATRAAALAGAEDTQSLRALILVALHADTHGQPRRSLDALLKALAVAATSDDPLAPQLSEFLLHALAGLEGAAPEYRPRLVAALDAHRAGLPLPARFVAQELRMRFAQQMGDLAQLRAVAVEAGCVQQALGTEPFGARALLGFDEDHGIDPAAKLQGAYDLGEGRGRQPVRMLTAHGCTLHLGGGPLADGGTRYLQFPLQKKGVGDILLRIDTPNTFELFIDGASALRVDRRTSHPPRIHYLPLRLPAGEHLVTVKVASRHPSPVLSLSLSPYTQRDQRAIALPKPLGGDFRRFILAALHVVRGDAISARQVLAEAGEQVSPYLLMQQAEVTLADPLIPEDVRADEARVLLQRAQQSDKGLWSPALQIAALAESNGRIMEAIDALRELSQRFPDVAAIGMRLADALRSKGWDDAADLEIARLRRLVPDACAPMQAELSTLVNRGRHAGADKLVEPVMACDATTNARYSKLLRERDWAAASEELRRLEQFASPQLRYAYLISGLELAREQRDETLRKAILVEMRSRYPRSETAVLEHVDALLEEGKTEAALQALQTAFGAETASMLELNRLLPVLGAASILEDYRKDGLARIAEFERSGRSYEGPQVLVFDYMAIRVFDDGSSLELVHSIQRAQSDEAVDALAEVSVPEDARVLNLRVVKADGRLLEADAIAGKDTVSLPGMAQGDYVELEYVRAMPPPDGFPGGYASDRFFFTSYEVPFDHSELVVLSSDAMPLRVDPRGPAPEAVLRKAGGLVERRFVVDESPALSPEPATINPREFVPSVRLGYKATWGSFIESIREVLVDRDVFDPDIQSLVKAVIGDAAPDDHRLRAQRLYDFVLEEIENDDDIFSQAAVMFRSRSGNRARLLHYLLGLADVPSRLVLVRSAAADQTPSPMADTDTYEHLLVQVGEGPDAWLLFTPETHAPFGYIPSLLRGQPAIALVEGAPELSVPAGQVGDELRLIDATIDLADDGSATLHLVERIRGAGAASWRRELESVPPVELERRFEQEYVTRLLPGARLLKLDVTGRTRDDAEIVLRYEVGLDALSRKTQAGWAVPALFSSELTANYARVPTRTTTMFTGSLVETDIRLRFRFPQGARTPKAPPSFVLGGPGETLHFTAGGAYEGRDLLIRRTLRMAPQRVAPEVYPEFVKFCRAVDATEDREIVFAP